MSLTALVWALIYSVGLVAAFAHPLVGLLTYLFEYYLRPDVNWWGRDLPEFRSSLVAGIVVALSFALHRSHLPAVRSIFNLAMPFAVLMGVNVVLVSLLLSVNQEASWQWGTTLLKHLGLYLLIIGILRSREAFDAFALAHIAGSAWWGNIALTARRVSGRLEGVGSGDTGNSNLGAAHLVTVIPLMVTFALAVKDVRKRAIAIVATPLVINLFVLYNSRGALVGLAFAALMAVVLVHWRVRVRIFAAGLAAALVLLSLADPKFLERQQTTTSATDTSAQSRLESWKGGLKLVLDHPLGTGGRGFHTLSPIYIPNIVEGHRGEGRSVHNMYLQISSEWGIQGLLLFAGFIAATLFMLHQMRWTCTPGDPWYYRSVAVEVGLLGTLVAATFSDRFYGDSIYWMAALAFSACRIQATEYEGARQTDAAHAQSEQTSNWSATPRLRPHLPPVTIRERLRRSAES